MAGMGMGRLHLRMFEPDLVALASMNEVEATEKFLMETLTRVEERKKYLLCNHMGPFDPSPADMQQVFGLPPAPQQHEQQGDMGVSAFGVGGDVVSWFADAMPGAGPSIFAGPDPILAFRDQAIFDSLRRDAGVDLGMAAMCHVDQHGGGPSDDWQQAYTSAELLSALIPSTPFPLDDQVAARDDELDKTSTTALQPRFSVHELEAVIQDSMAPVLAPPMVPPPPHVHEQVEASAGSCSNVPPPGGDSAAAAAQEQQHGLPDGAVNIG
ncbi:hypothetical protein C2845_PM10G07860 [Panicum miliaceum]|uniref:Uncharacterized protein n=1 Tax=Panicum miliaceum TaxID=4540 RepID=A0A3L6PCN3_PANMI|nr:hypothetical protein C2845_PM10G07860 [Panicum miliaceum]